MALETLAKVAVEAKETIGEVGKKNSEFTGDKIDSDKRINPIEKNLSKTDVSPAKELFDKALERPAENAKEIIPQSNGNWTGEPGNSKWIPDDSYINPNLQANPEQKTMGQIKREYGFDGITFKNNEPNFSEVSKGTVKINSFTVDRNKNFVQADKKFAEANNMTPQEAKQYRKEHRLTWHERSDMKTMDLVPREIHDAIKHSGGIAKAKRLMNETGISTIDILDMQGGNNV